MEPFGKSEIVECHSKNSWTAEFLYSEEFDAVFQELFNRYLHGGFSQPGDRLDFQGFCRMLKQLKEKRNELEDKFFPEQAQERAEERSRVTVEEETQGCREFYEKLHEMTRIRKGSDGDGQFSWKKLFLGCFR